MARRQLSAAIWLVGLLAITGCQDRGATTIRARLGTEEEKRGYRAPYQAVTGVVTLHEGDMITVHVLNVSDEEQPCAIEIYRDTREGAREVGKNEGYKVRSRGIASCRLSVKTTGEYWVLVKGETPLLAPQATFAPGKPGEGDASRTPVVFKPGDFLKVEPVRNQPSYYGRGTEVKTTGAILRTEKATATEKATELKRTSKE
jgi:hypothetical protein